MDGMKKRKKFFFVINILGQKQNERFDRNPYKSKHEMFKRTGFAIYIASANPIGNGIYY